MSTRAIIIAQFRQRTTALGVLLDDLTDKEIEDFVLRFVDLSREIVLTAAQLHEQHREEFLEWERQRGGRLVQ